MPIADVQRFSLHDGPGIRTTVFLKGCNLRCRWCHNPESLRAEPQLQFLPDRCIGCGACLRACPRGAHRIEGDRRQFARELCAACGSCASACYARALVLVGGTLTVEDVVAEVAADREFYDSSGGGVTLSGGEPLLQLELAVGLLEACRARGIHTAVETNLAWPWERVAGVLPLTDLVIADVKMMDPAAHRRWTGAGNEQVLANAEKLSSEGVPLIVRTPVVAGVNATTEEIAGIADFARRLRSLLYYELLPYHPLGTGKYESLGLARPDEGLGRPDRRTLQALSAAARRQGVEVRCAHDGTGGGGGG